MGMKLMAQVQIEYNLNASHFHKEFAGVPRLSHDCIKYWENNTIIKRYCDGFFLSCNQK